MLGKGRAQAISVSDISNLAIDLACHPADLEAIAEVESNGFGWSPDGRIKILFEKHQFYKHLPEAKRDTAVRQKIARKDWISPKNGGYRDQSTPDARYKLLEKAIALDERAAYMAISIGRFQIMGFNHELCGYPSAKAMFTAFVDSEVYQLRAFAMFLRKKGLVPALRSRAFGKIEEVYNGGGLNGEYARRMKIASDRLRAGKWKSWSSDAATGAATKPADEPSKPVETRPAPVPPAAPSTPPAGRARGIWALLLAALLGAWFWIASLPCTWFGLFCGG